MCALRFIPREEKFFEYFAEQARLLCESAQLLAEGMAAGPDALAAKSTAIAALEKQADEINHSVFEKLRSTFITPLDPEDIHTLASTLENAIDGTDQSAKRIAAYRPKQISPAMSKLSRHLVDASTEVQKGLLALKDGGDVHLHVRRIRELEEISDAVAQDGLLDLFQNEKDPIEVIKGKDLLELLEETIDFCDDIANILANVVVKNS